MIEPRERVPYHGPSGLSFCFAPPEKILDPRDPKNSLHHGNHSQYGRAYIKNLGPYGPAVYASRVQLVESIYHNADYNQDPNSASRQLSYHPTFLRSKVPQSEVGQARITLFGALRTVGGKVLDFKAGRIRQITTAERERLFKSGELGIQSRELVSQALTQFAISRGMPHLVRAEIDAYRDSRWETDRKAIVIGAVERILPVAFGPIEARFAEAMADGSLPPDTPPTAYQSAGQFIMDSPLIFTIFETAMNERGDCRIVA